MKEIIVQVVAYSADYPKAPIYVADLIRCGECKYEEFCERKIHRHGMSFEIDFCSYGVRKESE